MQQPGQYSTEIKTEGNDWDSLYNAQSFYPGTDASWHSRVSSYPTSGMIGYQTYEGNPDTEWALNQLPPTGLSMGYSTPLPQAPAAATSYSSLYGTQPFSSTHMGYPADQLYPAPQSAPEMTVPSVSRSSESTTSAQENGATNRWTSEEIGRKTLMVPGYQDGLDPLQKSLAAYLKQEGTGGNRTTEDDHLRAIRSGTSTARVYIAEVTFNAWWDTNKYKLRLLPLLDLSKAPVLDIIGYTTSGVEELGGPSSRSYYEACYNCFLKDGGFYITRRTVWQTCMCPKQVVIDRRPLKERVRANAQHDEGEISDTSSVENRD